MKCAICHETTKASELAECPCGKKVCDQCQDMMYTDEVCCKQCADEIRAAWEACPEHEFDAPYENEDGDMIKQCKHCDFPQRAEEESDAQ